MCRRDTTDPLVRKFLNTYRLNLLTIPRSGAMCGEVYLANGTGVPIPVKVTAVLVPPPVLPEVALDEKLADLTQESSAAVSADIGLGLLGNLLMSFGASRLIPKLKARYGAKNASHFRFRLREVTRDRMDPTELDSAIGSSKLIQGRPFFQDTLFYLVAGVVRAQSLTITALDGGHQAIEFDIDAAGLDLLQVGAGVSIEQTSASEVTYSGGEKLAIAVELYKLGFDQDSGHAFLANEAGPPRPVRAGAYRPAFIGGDDGDAFI